MAGCHAGSCTAASISLSRVSSRICAEPLASSALTAGRSLRSTMASEIVSPRLLRRAIAQSLLERPEEAIISSRSRSEEHTSELQSLMRISYAVFCLKKKINTHKTDTSIDINHD